MKFASSDTDRQTRWVVTENSPTPTLVVSKPQPQPQPQPQQQQQQQQQQQAAETPPGKQGEDTPSEEGGEEERFPALSNKGKMLKRGRRGQKGRPKGEIYFTDYEHEMIEWARNGFQPTGPEGLWPTEEEQQDLFMVVSADTVDPTGDGNGEMFDFPAPPKKKFAALMKQQKGEPWMCSSNLPATSNFGIDCPVEILQWSPSI